MHHYCPICQEPSQFLAHGLIAPWILSLWGRNLKEMLATTLERCGACELTFFSHRYNAEETRGLYQKYRQQEWYRIRHSFEPWYLPGTNDAYIGPEANKKIAYRKVFTESILSGAGLDLDNLGDYLDFGGDSGQFFPKGVSGRRILFDLQSAQMKNVETISNLSELVDKVDIVSNCYVLEHVSDIKENLKEMRNCLKESGHLLIELPFDGFKVSRFHRSSIYRKYLSLIYQVKPLFISIDFFTGLFRQFFNMIPFFGIVKQSEHINYFTPSGLINLVENQGFFVKFATDPERRNFVGLIKQGRFGIICSLN